MGLTELRKKREKRWDELLNYAYSECDRKYSKPSSTSTMRTVEEDRYLISELSKIRFSNDSYLEQYLNDCIESNFTFLQYYQKIHDAIPIKWFEKHSQTDENYDHDEYFQEYNSLDILAGLSESTRQMIWIDLPRTFNIFMKRSPHCCDILSNLSRKSYYLTVLCRILSTTSCLLGGWYCQGMSFVAASYIFYYDDISAALWIPSNFPSPSSTTATVNEEITLPLSPSPPPPASPPLPGVIDFQHDLFLLHENYACCTYYHLILHSNNLSALYEWSVFLTMYLEEFEYQLSHTPETSRIYRHLQELNYPIEFFSMEWFTTCYVLSTSYDVSVHIQDMMIHGNQSGSRVDILIRIGMAIIIALGPEILRFEGKTSLSFPCLLCLLKID
jgi:hypothetical protein